MRNVLILFAHPRLEKSRANRALLRHIPQSPNITFHDLYERYADYNIDVDIEKDLLVRNDVIVWHHPFYWYSSPPLLKQWIDMVLEFGWAYGPGGTALQDKIAFNVITTGGAPEAYARDGRNRFSIREFLVPFEQTARLCRMIYVPPFAVQGTHRLGAEQLELQAAEYGVLLRRLAAGEDDPQDLQKHTFLNELVRGTRV